MDFEKIVTAESQGILLDYEGQKHFLDLNLLTPKGCGSVTSAVYKTAQSVEMNLLKRVEISRPILEFEIWIRSVFSC